MYTHGIVQIHTYECTQGVSADPITKCVWIFCLEVLEKCSPSHVILHIEANLIVLANSMVSRDCKEGWGQIWWQFVQKLFAPNDLHHFTKGHRRTWILVMWRSRNLLNSNWTKIVLNFWTFFFFRTFQSFVLILFRIFKNDTYSTSSSSKNCNRTNARNTLFW